MNTLFCLLALLPMTFVPDEPPVVAPTEARTPAEEKKLFKLPPGFEAQLVAAEPDIAKPINLAFDSRGRLWVTSSLEYPFPAQGRPGRDMVHILSDFAPAGKARQIITFAKDLNIPLGVYPRPDGAILYSINSIDRLYAKEGQAYDRREKLYAGFGSRDTHGMVNSFTRGLDGWLYACHGYANDSATRGSDGHELRMNSGNVFRMKLDGSHVEAYTRGQVNPFGMCQDPWGNLYTADCHTRPMTQILRGAYYDSFGKPHDGLGYAPNMMGHMHDSTGLAGLVFYDADQFPKAYQGTMFVGNVVTSRINHDQIIYHGSTPEAVLQPDFLSSDDPWFRPVFMVLGPDGALYVADFYNRIIGHYEVPLSHPGRDRQRGRIWRIVYHGKDVQPSPAPHGADFAHAQAEQLVQDLDHPNLTVRNLATQELADRVPIDTEALKRHLAVATPQQQSLLLWVLERWNALSDEELQKALRHEDPLVRVHALRILAERPRRSDPCNQQILRCLSDSHPLVQRCAAEALATDQTATVGRLQALQALRQHIPAADTHLLHMVRIALRNQAAALPDAELAELSAEAVKLLNDICLGIGSARGGEIALRILQQNPSWSDLIPRLVQHAARYIPHDITVLSQFLETYQADPRKHALLMQGLVQGLRQGPGVIPNSVKQEAATLSRQLCQAADPQFIQIGLELCANARLVNQFDLVKSVVLQEKLPEPQCTQAIATLAALNPKQAEQELSGYLTNNRLPLESRERAATLLAGFNNSQARQALLAALATVPSRLANVIAYNLANSIAGAGDLLLAVESNKLPPHILLTTSVQLRILNHKRSDFNQRYAKLTQDLPPADARLAELVHQRLAEFKPHSANAQIGKKLFTQHCAVCHQIAGEGAKVGPNLDGVGIRGPERLLEDILDPNRNVDQAFRASVLVLQDGRTLTGLVLREEGNLIILADNLGKEQKIGKSEIEDRKVSNLSPMPANFDTQISGPELEHLLAYLLTQQAKK
jgi:putative heme-binding domain-containing protein